MKKIVFLATAFVMMFALPAGCTSANLVSIAYPQSAAFDDYETQSKIREDNAVDESIISSINEFSSKSASMILGNEQRNSCYSPLSLYMALAMLSTGAAGETQNELLTLLKQDDTAYLSEQMGKLYRLMYKNNDISTFFMTNSLWMNDDFEIKKTFVDNAMKNFYTAANTLDFNDTKAEETISSWINDNTNKLLKPEINIDPLDLLYIVNTAYLKDEWQDNFEEDATSKDTFTLSDGTKVNAEFMHGTFDSSIIKGDGFTAVSLPLKNAGSMMFVLPNEETSVNSLLSTPEYIAGMLRPKNVEHGSVNLSLPKFSYDSEFNLIQSLKDMGVTKAFDAQEADLTGIIDMDLSAFVSAVKQGTNITVNENGLEAAAYTYIAVSLECAPMETQTLELDFDRPFIFITLSENVPVFIGMIQNPAN